MYKFELLSRFDYSQYATFRTIDRFNDGFIDSHNLSTFFKNNGHYATQSELLAIIRRIDTDGDAKLSYTEFIEYLNTGSSSSIYQREAELSKSRTFSIDRTTRQIAQA